MCQTGPTTRSEQLDLGCGSLRSNIENERIYEVVASKYMEGDKVHVLGIDVSRESIGVINLHGRVEKTENGPFRCS